MDQAADNKMRLDKDSLKNSGSSDFCEIDYDIKITDAGKTSFAHFKKNIRQVFLLGLFLGSFFAVWALFSGLAFWVACLAVLFAFPIVALTYYEILFDSAIRNFLKQFAQDNGFNYQRGLKKTIDAPVLLAMRGSFFAEDAISGNFIGYPFSIFNIHYEPRHNDMEFTKHFTMALIDYKTNLPRIFLESRRHKRSLENVKKEFDREAEQMVILEGDFNKYFDLYIPKEYEIEALQIFTPDVMAVLIDRSKAFDLEFFGDHLYVYSHKLIKSKKDLCDLYDLLKLMVNELAPTLERLSWK